LSTFIRLNARRTVVAFALTALAVAIAPAAYAQQQNSDPQAKHLLDVEVAVSSAYDSDEALVPGASGFTQVQPSGYSSWGTASLQYLRRFNRVELQTAAASAVQYFSEVREVRSVSHIATVALDVALPNRLGLEISETAAYSPPYLYGLFPALPAVPDETITVSTDQDYDVDASSSYMSATSLVLTRRMNRRTTVSLTGDYSITRFQDARDLTDVTSFSIGPRFSRDLTRNTSISLGYLYRGGGYGYATEAVTREHVIDVGYNITRRLSPTKTLNLAFSGGGSRVEIPENLAVFGVHEQQYQVNGGASIAYPVLRTGEVRGSFTRRLQFVAGLTEPAFVNGYTAEFISGPVRGMDFLARFSKATGQSAFTSDDLLDTYSGQVRLAYQIVDYLQVYGEYLHYFYETGGESDAFPLFPLAPGIPADLKRNGARIGVMWHVPVLRR
jgi:hypothetical protein